MKRKWISTRMASRNQCNLTEMKFDHNFGAMQSGIDCIEPGLDSIINAWYRIAGEYEFPGSTTLGGSNGPI